MDVGRRWGANSSVADWRHRRGPSLNSPPPRVPNGEGRALPAIPASRSKMTVAASPARAMVPADLALYAGTVLIWSTTWLALKFQLGTVDPQVSIVWRFSIAAPLMFLVCRIAGAPIRFPWRMHLRFAALGLFLYSTNFILFYNAGKFVVSGLLSVIFSLAAVTNIALAVLFLGEPLRPRVALGALIGLAGMALMFWHEIGRGEIGLGGSDFGPLVGLALGFLGCLSFSTGNILSARIQCACLCAIGSRQELVVEGGCH